MHQPILSPDLQRLVDARHNDPFAVLGRHSEGENVLVRALLPHAEAVTFADGGHSLQRIEGTDIFEWRGRGGRGPGALSADLARPTSTGSTSPTTPTATRPVPGLRPAPVRRGPHWHAYRLLGARVHEADGCRRRPVLGLGTECRAGQRGGRLQPLGRARPPDAGARQRGLGAVHPRPAARRGLQVRDPGPERRRLPQVRPLRSALRVAPQDRLHRRAAERLRLVRRGLAGRPRRARLAARAHVHLRGAPGLLAARARGRDAQLPGDRPAPGGARLRSGLHPHRADAGHRAPLRQVLGLSDHRLLRPHQPLRQPGRLPLVRRPLPRQRHRRRSWTGCRPTSPRTPMGWPASTARPSTSTRTRAWASTWTGPP